MPSRLKGSCETWLLAGEEVITWLRAVAENHPAPIFLQRGRDCVTQIHIWIAQRHLDLWTIIIYGSIDESYYTLRDYTKLWIYSFHMLLDSRI